MPPRTVDLDSSWTLVIRARRPGVLRGGSFIPFVGAGGRVAGGSSQEAHLAPQMAHLEAHLRRWSVAGTFVLPPVAHRLAQEVEGRSGLGSSHNNILHLHNLSSPASATAAGEAQVAVLKALSPAVGAQGNTSQRASLRAPPRLISRAVRVTVRRGSRHGSRG